ncbi:MAG: Ig-like domain-containing protein [Oscillospiraceae bacterium]|nr:Ig-like domain-containing protein [Oscillospiraceae bacterium]
MKRITSVFTAFAVVLTLMIYVMPMTAFAAYKLTMEDGTAVPAMIDVGDSFKIKVEGANVYFYSDDKNVVTVGKTSGKLTAVGPGEASIRGVNQSTGKTIATKTIDVCLRATSITPSESEIYLTDIGNTAELSVTMTPSNSTDIIRYFSDNKDVATVTQKTGVVTAEGEGTATITIYSKRTAASEADDEGNATASVKVTVGKFLSSVSARTDQTIEVKFTQEVNSLTADDLILQEASETTWMKIKSVTKLSSDTYLIQLDPEYKMSDKKYTLTMKKTGSKLEFNGTTNTCEHNWQETGEIPANCTECRQIIMTCSLCQQQKNVPDETVKALGHIETQIVVVRQPTCTVNGVQYYVCDRCGRAIDSAIDKLPHNYVESSQRIPATCAEPEYIVMECSGCGAIEKIPVASELKDHSFDENGICTVCGTYRISNEDELFRFAEAVNGGNVNINALMTDNVVCTRGWTPIGTYKYRYMGTFDGHGHTISGLHADINDSCVGLFAFIGSDGLVSQIGLVDSSVIGRNEVGGIAGRNSGVIRDCFSIVELRGSDYIGGICGTNYGTIENCYSLVKMAEKKSAGGVCGSETYTSKITNCYYNNDIYRYDNGIGTGVSTFDMISENALTLMKLDGKIWTVKPYDSTTLYFPGFKETSVFPYYVYDARLTIDCAGTEPFTVADGLIFSLDAQIKISESIGYFSIVTDGNADKLELYADNVKLSPDMTYDSDGVTAEVTDRFEPGEHSFVVKFTGNAMFDGKTAEKILDLGPAELTSADFIFSPGLSLEYNGIAHSASVVPAAWVNGIGKITVKYFDENGTETEPVNFGVYTVKIDVEQGSVYSAINGLTDESWKFTIGKMTLTADDIRFTPPAELSYSGSAKAAYVTSDRLPEEVNELLEVKYFDENNNEAEPITPGIYTVSVSVNESDNIAGTTVPLTSDDWNFTIVKAVKIIPDVELPYIWTDIGNKSVEIKGLPDDTGDMEEPVVVIDDPDPDVFTPDSVSFSNGILNFDIPTTDSSAVGKSSKITITLKTQNYEDMTFSVTIQITDKKPQQAPECVVSIQQVSTTSFNVVIEPIDGAEYKFDGISWSLNNVYDFVDHDTEVVAYIRMKETSEYSASDAASATVRTGHGELTHHEAVSSTCTVNGNIEYWSCDLCQRYFIDPDAKNEVSLESTVLPFAKHISGEPKEDSQDYKEPECGIPGYRTEVAYCTVCNEELSRTRIEIPALEHLSSKVLRDNEVPAKCDKSGSYDEYTECLRCGIELSRKTIAVPAKGHTPGEPVKENEIPATCGKDGSYDEAVYCIDCKTELSRDTVTVPKLDHIWSAEYRKDQKGHWHICENCNQNSEIQPHISGGPATYTTPEICTVCAYEISPRKSSGGSGGSSGGSGRGSTEERKESLPSLNENEISWKEIAAMLEKLAPGSHAVIELNGNTDVSEKIFAVMVKNSLTVEFVLDSTKSWVVDGAGLDAVSDADMSVLPGKADKKKLRGTVGADLKISGMDITAGLKLNFRKQFAGHFANLYRLVNEELQFQNCARVGEDGSVTLPGADSRGEYVVMVCSCSDLPGDMNNDGVLNALDASAVLKYIVGTETAANTEVSDLNGDNTVNALDASVILKKAVGF